MVAKGHDIKNIYDLVFISADSALNSRLSVEAGQNFCTFNASCWWPGVVKLKERSSFKPTMLTTMFYWSFIEESWLWSILSRNIISKATKLSAVY